jgi:adenylate kinase
MVETLEDRLQRDDCAAGFILDGFPRTVAQAEALDTMLERLGATVPRVVSLRVRRGELVKRLTGRRTCRDCGAMYHIIYDPPTNAALCNKCQGELYQRDDDHEDIIASRLDVYETQTEPLLAYYDDRGVLVDIDGAGTREDVMRRIYAGLGVAA